MKIGLIATKIRGNRHAHTNFFEFIMLVGYNLI